MTEPFLIALDAEIRHLHDEANDLISRGDTDSMRAAAIKRGIRASLLRIRDDIRTAFTLIDKESSA